MKKILALLLAGCMAFALCACGNTGTDADADADANEIGRASCRERVCQYV